MPKKPATRSFSSATVIKPQRTKIHQGRASRTCSWPPSVFGFGFEDRDGARRGERHGVDGGDDHRGGDRQRELAEELAGDAGEECAGQEHADQHQRDGENRPGDFVHRFDGGGFGIVAFGDPAFDVFQHHDGVVDHDADGQHQAEQREVVQVEAQQGHDGERADQRDGHVDHRQDHRLPILQEEQHDDGDENDGVAQGFEHFHDRLFDEGSRVVDDFVVEAAGEALVQLLHVGLDLVGHLQGVGAGQLEDGQGDRGFAVELADLVVLLGAEIDFGDIAEANDLGGGRAFLDVALAGFDDDVAELLGRDQAAQRAHRELELLILGHGRLADGAGGDLHVLAFHGVDDVGGVQAHRGHFVGIEPDAHAVFALAEVVDVADAVDAQADRLESGWWRSC